MSFYSSYSYEKERADRHYDDWKDETVRCKKFKKTVEEAVKSYYV